METAMYMDFKVRIPADHGGVSKKSIKSGVYIYYSFGRIYKPDKKYNSPQTTTIGKWCEDDPEMMYPNQNFFKFFPDAEFPEEKRNSVRSGCLKLGAFLVIRKIIAGYHLDERMDALIGKDSGLFLDLCAYSIITENNTGQYYPDYAYNHPLFTQKMKVYSDTKVSDFLRDITRDQSLAFQEEWNESRDHREKIYISYDSTNKDCQAGDIELAEIGHPKDGQDKPVINYSIAYDRDNSEPLFYEDYPGSIVDVSQLQYMLEKAKGYGYRNVGFILDRGYFSKKNIHFMDSCGYEFVIMVKGMKKFVKGLVLQVKGSFEDKRQYSIRRYQVSGTTVKARLYEADEKERYFHIYFSEKKRTAERETVESKIDRFADTLKKHEGTQYKVPENFNQYFDLIYYHEGQPDEKFMCANERTDVIDREIDLCGYFVIITSEKMTAEEALDLYKSRDASEKLFRGDKSYLGNHSYGTQTAEATHAKIFIEFVALIIRNRIYTSLRDRVERSKKKQNYMTVPAAIRELEKIEMIRQPDGTYRLDHAVSATQKEILSAFQMSAESIREQARAIGDDIQKLEA